MGMRIYIKNTLLNLFKVTTLAVLAVHFTLTFLYVMPTTPIKLEQQRLLNLAVGTVFPQNWSLFAPNPIARNESLLAMCLPEGNGVSDMRQLPKEGWEDLTFPLWHGLQRNRFTAYGRIERTQGNSIRQYQGLLIGLDPWRESCRKGSAESCEHVKEKTEEARGKAEPQLIKMASSYCSDSYEKPVQFVAIRIRTDTTLSWSKRHTGIREYIDSDVGVFPIDRDTTISGIYQRKGGR